MDERKIVCLLKKGTCCWDKEGECKHPRAIGCNYYWIINSPDIKDICRMLREKKRFEKECY